MECNTSFLERMADEQVVMGMAEALSGVNGF